MLTAVNAKDTKINLAVYAYLKKLVRQAKNLFAHGLWIQARKYKHRIRKGEKDEKRN